MSQEVVFLNPLTCGLYRDGRERYKIDESLGQRTEEIDNEMAEHVQAFMAGQESPGVARVGVDRAFENGVLVPRYYDNRWLQPFDELCKMRRWEIVSLGELIDKGVIEVGAGHGSPSGDLRSGSIPYVKVSDIRALRINVNPTNLVTRPVAERHWRGQDSGLEAWDLISPRRASSNIGEFAILLPGEEQIVLTKEMFRIRVLPEAQSGWSPFYLLWAFSLQAVRLQWQRIALMQTNREDCGERYREIKIPDHDGPAETERRCGAFREYFTAIAEARTRLTAAVGASGELHIASVTGGGQSKDSQGGAR